MDRRETSVERLVLAVERLGCFINRAHLMTPPSCMRVALVLLSAAACGGRSALDDGPTATSPAHDASATPLDARVDATGPRDARADGAGEAATDGGLSCQPAFVEAGSGLAGDAEIPIYHRAIPSCCPSERAAGPPPQPYGSGMAAGCSLDSQCTDGGDGRCFPFEGLVGPGGCSYDACFTDSDCSGAPCVCRASAADNNANVCAPGGNCALDSDCGSGGYCSPSQACPFYGPPVYYCHTASDACINDVDCPIVGPGGACEVPQVCVYDPQAQHWACSQQACCLP